MGEALALQEAGKFFTANFAGAIGEELAVLDVCHVVADPLG